MSRFFETIYFRPLCCFVVNRVSPGWFFCAQNVTVAAPGSGKHASFCRGSRLGGGARRANVVWPKRAGTLLGGGGKIPIRRVLPEMVYQRVFAGWPGAAKGRWLFPQTGVINLGEKCRDKPVRARTWLFYKAQRGGLRRVSRDVAAGLGRQDFARFGAPLWSADSRP